MQNEILISIIIASYNRAYIIDHCLQSLVEQSVSQDIFEVIVVNNNSTDNTDEVVQSFEGKIKNLTLAHEVKQGAGHARNAGIAVAKGGWIACLDSDAKAHSNWVEIILREIKKNSFDAFGGPFLAWHHYGSAPVWFSENWETSLEEFNYYGLIPHNKGVPTSGNGVFKKSILDVVGLFPTDMGMAGNNCAYGEETKLFEDMRHAGFRLGSVPDLLIDHCVLPYKYTLLWRLKATFAMGYSFPYICASRSKLSQFPRRIAGLLLGIVRIPYGIVQGVIKKHPAQRILLDSTNHFLLSLGRLCAYSKILGERFLFGKKS